MSFNLKDYYNSLSGQSDFVRGEWYVDYDKKHLFKIYSDYDALDEHSDSISLPPSSAQTNLINIFSEQINQKIKNTKIVPQPYGTERVELELEDRIITVVMDQSGSMTWSDSGNFRYSIVESLVNRIEESYPGNITYNLITFGGTLVNVLFFGIIEEEGVDTTEFDTLAQLILGDEDANFAGVRVMRSATGYPSDYGGIDGDEVDSGFIKSVVDEGLSEGITYYYKVFTYDKNLKMSKGVGVKVTPRERDIPRGISIFKTFIDTDDIHTGQPLIGYGINRDDYTIGLWHMGEGEGRNVFDFSNSNVLLTHTSSSPVWYGSRYVPSGTSGLIFNGTTDYLKGEDTNSDFEITWEDGNTEITISAWIYPYPVSDLGIILARAYALSWNYAFGVDSEGALFFNNGNDDSYSTSGGLFVENYKWQYVSVTYSGSNVTFRINDRTCLSSMTPGVYSDSSPHSMFIGCSHMGIYSFCGGITEVSIHNTIRSSSYLSSQLITESVYDGNGDVVDSNITGVKDDNGDRLVVLKYEIPQDYNFDGGSVRIVKNEKRIPTWEEDGEIIYDEEASPGIHYVSDPRDFVAGETYYYRIFSQNSIGNFSFLEDSSYVSVYIPSASTNSYFLSLDTPISNPTDPGGSTQSIVAGNKKIYLRWKNPVLSDTRVLRAKIYYSRNNYPVVGANGQAGGELVYTALSDEALTGVEAPETGFVHRVHADGSSLLNDSTYYYSIFFIDKYGRSSGYNDDGSQNDTPYPVYHLAATPSLDADESLIPLKEVENLRYEVVNENVVSVNWDMDGRNPSNIESYFDQTVLLYSSITDEFGDPISSDTPIKMSIQSVIIREEQADDVFNTGKSVDFTDKDAYNFFVTRNENGILKATLKMTSNVNITSQIKEATFTVQLKCYVPKEGAGSTITNSVSGDAIGSLEEYNEAIQEAIDEIEGNTTPTSASNNIFEYYTAPITVHFTNPWDLELISRDNQKVSETCYVYKTDEETKEQYLTEVEQKFNGVYMKSSSPFVSRVKLKYKGEPITTGTIDVAVWDADFSKLCQNAGSDNAIPYEGEKIAPSTLVVPPSSQLSVKQGYETVINAEGESEQVEISYVDIPLYAPSVPNAVRLFVKGTNAGYSSVKNIYILFQSILKISLEAVVPNIDGKSIQEQQATVFIINPNYPNYKTNSYDYSLIQYPVDHTVVEWRIAKITSNVDRNLYSIDQVPRVNGVFSYTYNGVAGNVFLGPIPIPSESIEESHEISAKVVYQGLTTEVKRAISIKYDLTESKQFESKFLMEIDGGYNQDGVWTSHDWMNPQSSPLWADGTDYRRVKICRNPSVASLPDFRSSYAFKECAEEHGLTLLELSSNHVVYINPDNSGVEVVHGEVSEEMDPYSGEHYLSVGEDGLAEIGPTYIQLEDSSTSDITYFYVRINAFVPDAGLKAAEESETVEEQPINACLYLKPSDGLFKVDIPKWSPIVYVKGSATVFVNNKPLVLTGGGDFYTGIPPCPIAIQEPLGISTVWRKVIHYSYDGDQPSDIVAEEIDIGTDDFLDPNSKSYILWSSDVQIRVAVTWRGGNVPDNTPVYVSIGDNTTGTTFMSERSIYYTSTDPEEGYSYADITIHVRKSPSSTITETVEIFTTYDKNETVDRRMSRTYRLTLEYETASVNEPGVTGPNEEETWVEPPTPHSKTLERYHIESNTWDIVSNMSESKGNTFTGVCNNSIYVMGGLKNNNLDISAKNEVYDSASDLWSTKKNIPTPRFAGMTISYNDKIYAIGGIGVNPISRLMEVSLAVECYDPVSDVWTSLSPMPTIDENGTFDYLGVAFGTSSVTVIDGKPYIYVVGGIRLVDLSLNMSNIRGYSERVLRYSIDDDLWEYSAVLRSDELLYYQRISPLSIVYNGKMIIFGGAIENSGVFTYPSEAFTINMDSTFPASGEKILTIGSSYMPNLPVPKFQSAMAVYDENPSIEEDRSYYILGGANKISPSLDLLEKITTGTIFSYESSYDSNISLKLESLLTPKHGASAAVCMALDNTNPDLCVYLIGGYTTAQGNTYVDIEFDI